MSLKKILIALIIVACLGGAVGGLLVANLKNYGRTPLDPEAGNAHSLVFTIAPGDCFRLVARRLADSAIIRSPFRFRVLARLNDQDRQIKTGEYQLVSTQSPGEILATLIDGNVILYRLTVPEGYNLKQIAQSVAATGLIRADDFLSAADDPRLRRSLQINGPSLEGYLFPDTYHFPRSTDASTIVRTMVHRLKAIFTPAWEKTAQQAGFSVHQVLTLASIIEKETGDPGERALISSVFHNRLKKKMRLASDPTVIYGIADFDGNLTRKHLRTAGPYNTYLNTGLPPGPIASPGAEAIKAALFPEKSNYLFFVSKKNGTHQFSTNFTAHKRAVKKYQLNR